MLRLKLKWNKNKEFREHVTNRVCELMKYLEKSLKNTCEGAFLKNILDLQPVDLLNNDFVNRIFLRTLIKLSKYLFEQAMVAVSIVR